MTTMVHEALLPTVVWLRCIVSVVGIVVVILVLAVLLGLVVRGSGRCGVLYGGSCGWVAEWSSCWPSGRVF